MDVDHQIGRKHASTRKHAFVSVLGGISVLAIWELVAIIVDNSDFFPSIEKVILHGLLGFSAFSGVTENEYSLLLGVQVLSSHCAASVTRYAFGVVGGIIVGFLMGVALAKYETINRIIRFPFDMARSLPLLGFMPIFLLWFGDAELGKILYILWSTIIIITVATVQAIQNVPPTYRQFARTLGASDGQIYRSVVIPAMIPELTGTIRVILALGWGFVLAAEFIVSQKGLGHLAILSQMFFYPDRLVLITAVFVVLSGMTSMLFLAIVGRVLRWQPQRKK